MNIKNAVLTMLGIVIRLGITVAVVYYIYTFSVDAYNFGYNVFADIPAAVYPGKDVEVTITESMGEKEIAKYFEEVGLTKDWKLFFVQEKFSEYKDNVKPGVYALNTSMKSEEIMAVIGAIPEEGEDIEGYETDENAEPVSNAATVTETVDEEEMLDDHIDNGLDTEDAEGDGTYDDDRIYVPEEGGEDEVGGE